MTHKLDFVRHSRQVVRAELAKVGEFESVDELSDLFKALASEQDRERLDAPCDALASAIEVFARRENVDFFRDVWPRICAWLVDDASSGELTLMLQDSASSERVSETNVRFILANAFVANLASCDEIVALGGVSSDVGIDRFFGSLSFVDLYTRPHCVESEQRLLCLLAFFVNASDADPDVFVEFERFVEPPLPDTEWLACNKRITRHAIEIHSAFMEDVMQHEKRPAFFDFANRDLHIGRVIPSCTQEEILFSCAPACFVALLICERMNDQEVIAIRGVRRFALYTGYLGTFRYAGFNPRHADRFDVIAADACNYSHWSHNMIIRDFNKARNTFMRCKAVSSGAWGCGAFGGDFAAKFVQMTATATLTDTFMFMSALGERCDEAKELLDAAIRAQLAVSDCVRYLLQYKSAYATGEKRPSFHHFFVDRCKEREQKLSASTVQ